MPKLTDPWFEAEFYGNATDKSLRRQGAQIEGAQGLVMYCPCAYGREDARAHGLIVPFANPRNAPALPADHGPTRRHSDVHTRWEMSGSGLDDLTLSPSIDVGEPSCWHGYIKNGEVT